MASSLPKPAGRTTTTSGTSRRQGSHHCPRCGRQGVPPGIGQHKACSHRCRAAGAFLSRGRAASSSVIRPCYVGTELALTWDDASPLQTQLGTDRSTDPIALNRPRDEGFLHRPVPWGASSRRRHQRRAALPHHPVHLAHDHSLVGVCPASGSDSRPRRADAVLPVLVGLRASQADCVAGPTCLCRRHSHR